MSIMQDLYDSEINCSISTFWDGGFDVKIGDDMNGFQEEATVQRYFEAEAWLKDTAIRLMPDSQFALIYRDGKSSFQANELIREGVRDWKKTG